MTAQLDYRIAAVDRSLVVMESLAEHPEQGVTEISERLGMTKSLVFRILQTLEGRGFAARDASRSTWSLGYRLTVLGERAGHSAGLNQAARPIMDALRDTTSESVNLIVRDGKKSLVVMTRDGRHSMRLFAIAGRYGPLHAGGGSCLLLAYAPADIQESILNRTLRVYTDRTMINPDQLRERLQRIRQRGWHIAQSDLDEGAFSVAAPVRDAAGEVVAAISVAGAVARFDEERRDLHLTAVLKAAEQISNRLGLGPSAVSDEVPG